MNPHSEQKNGLSTVSILSAHIWYFMISTSAFFARFWAPKPVSLQFTVSVHVNIYPGLPQLRKRYHVYQHTSKFCAEIVRCGNQKLRVLRVGP